ncbi:uncharacterized protein [Mobula birostris]|uniref:uncharacterized protein n=2 Tax=Mobula birostris TaxID=1983395 RepID=UPI003B27FABB
MSPAELRVVLLILGFLVTDSTLGDPCVTHTVLDQPWRSTDCSNTECTGRELMDDRNLEVGWYRFNSSGGWKIPETVVPQYRCSKKNPGWMDGPHPNVGDGEVTRTICFTSNKKPCDKKQEIRVKNCSGYFVYRLWPTLWDHTVYCTVTDSTLGDPCVNHTVLDQPWRSTDCSNTECTGGRWMGDGNLEVGWYRFNSSVGWKIPETVVPQGRCSGETSGWLNGPHPNVGEGEVTRTICFTSNKNPCDKKQEIRVKNCSGYFVYRLWPKLWDHTVYCTVTDSTLGDPCVTHTVLDQPWRSTDCSNTECTSGQWMGDGNLEVGWYRFNSSGGWKIPETVVPQGRCSGEIPGWLNGPHPNVGEGEVTRTVCFSKDKNTCEKEQEIRVKNCSGYFVYWLWPVHWDHAVYCTDPQSDTTREPQGAAMGEPGLGLTTTPEWSASSDSQPDTTHKPQGSVTGEPGLGLTITTAGSSSLLTDLQTDTTPKPQGSVTDLEASTMDQPDESSRGQPTPSPSSVSVGETSSDLETSTMEQPTGLSTGEHTQELSSVPGGDTSSVTDSTLGDPCVTHTVLDQPWRSTNCSNTECTSGRWMDDRKLEVGWYRFNSSGGWKIPESVIPQYRCSGERPGWLNGPHPNVGEEEVTRTVCFTVGEDSCHWSQEIRVKNCSGYFVYWLKPAPGNTAVYCTDLGISPREQAKGSSTGRTTQELPSVPSGDTSSDSQSDTTQDPQGSATDLEVSTLEQSTGLSTGEHTQELSSVPVEDTSSDFQSDTTREPQQSVTGDPGLGLTTTTPGSSSSRVDSRSDTTPEPQGSAAGEPGLGLTTTPAGSASADLEASTMDQPDGSSTGQPTPSPSSVSVGETSSDSQSDIARESQGSPTGKPGPVMSITPAGSSSSRTDPQSDITPKLQGTVTGSSTGKQTDGSVSGEHTQKSSSVQAGDTSPDPGTSTGKQSEDLSTGDFSQGTFSVPAAETTSGSSTGKQTDGSVSGEHTQKSSSVPAGDTSPDPGTSTGKQSEGSSTGDFSQETTSVPAGDTASGERMWIKVQLTSSGNMSEDEVWEATRQKIWELFGDPNLQIKLVRFRAKPSEE